MKKKIPFILIIVFYCIFAFSCNRPESLSSKKSMTEIVPETDKSFNNTEKYDALLDKKETGPLLNMKEDESLIGVMNLNLDLDSQDEQIVIYKDKNNKDGYISIYVVDYDNVKNSYERLWNSATLSQNEKTFVVYVDDIIGDHDLEIICSGRDNNGNTTMDIFWKNNRLTTRKYLNIYSISVHGAIEINQEERSRAYFQGLKNGISYTISVTKEDVKDEKNVLVQTVYYWDYAQKKYLLLSTEIIEKETNTEKELSIVTKGEKEDFFNFLSGPWYHENKIIYFDPFSESTVLYSSEIQETYTWQNSYKVLSTILFIRCKNEIINYIENEIYIKIENFNEVSITVRDIDTQTGKKTPNEIWTSKYIRMNENMKEKTIKHISSISKSYIPILNGQYLSDSGDIIEFFGNEFYLKIANESLKGGYAIYMTDVLIINLKIINSNGTVAEDRVYKLEYSEEYSEQIIKRIIVLTQGSLGIHGFHTNETNSLKFTQVETVEIKDFTDKIKS